MPQVIYLGLSVLDSADVVSPTPEALAQEPSRDVLTTGVLSDAERDALHGWLAQPEKPRALLVWPQPQAFLADALAQQEPPERALQHWLELAEQALGLFRRHRSQIVMLGVAPSETLADMTSLPDAWRDAAARVEAAMQPLRKPIALYRLAAAQLASRQVLKQQYAYLQASSHALSEAASNEPMGSIIKASLKRYQDLESEHDALRKERDALASQRDTLKKERDEAKQEYHREKKGNENLKSQVARAQSAIDTVLQSHKNDIEVITQQKDGAKEESRLLLDQLQKVQEALEESLEQHATLMQKHDSLLKEHKATKTTAMALKEERDRLVKEHASVKQALADEAQRHRAAAQAVKATEQQLARLEGSSTQKAQQLQHLQTQHATLQEAHTALTSERDRLAKEHASAQQALADETQRHRAAAQALKATEQQCEAARKENDLLVTQLHHAQEALETRETAYKRLSAQIREERHHHQQQLHELNCLIGWLRAHAYRHVAAAYRNIRSYKKVLAARCELVAQSELFDADWYRQRYPDVAQADISPVEHYVKFGALEGRDPSPLFNSEFYLTEHPDVAESGQHPLLHYLKDGIHEQRRTTPEAAA